MKADFFVRILAIVQLPPPVHGAAIINRMAIESISAEHHFALRVHPIRFSRKISEIREFSITKLLQAFRFIAQVTCAYLLQRPRVVYFTLSPSGPALYRDLLVSTVLRCLGARLVYHLHGVGLHAASRRSSLLRLAICLAFHQQHAIVLSKSLIGDVSWTKPASIDIVANGLDDMRQNASRSCSVLDPPVKLLYLSHVSRAKGIFVLLEALHGMLDSSTWNLTIAGEPLDVRSDELSERIRELGLGGRVCYAGPAYGESKWSLYREHDIFVLPSYNEALPLVVIEAMMNELATVATRVGGIPDIIENGANGILVSPGEPTQLSVALRCLIEDSKRRTELAHAARLTFEQRFTAELFRKGLNGVLQRLVR